MHACWQGVSIVRSVDGSALVSWQPQADYLSALFLRCPGRPTEEVTHHVVYDAQGRARVKDEGDD